MISNYVFVGNPEHEISALKIDFRDPWPIVVSYGILISQNYYTARSKSQEILYVVFTLMDVVKNSHLFVRSHFLTYQHRM